jgi:hypothetical protein
MYFCHQVGLLLNTGQLDTDYTLQLIGPCLVDRWRVLKLLAGYYETLSAEQSEFPHGGIYLLQKRYLKWKRIRFAHLRRAFAIARFSP